MYRTFNKSANDTRLSHAADTLEGRGAIHNDLRLTETSWEHSLKTNLLASSSAENDLELLDDSTWDMSHQPTWQQWELTASWALATGAQPVGWGKPSSALCMTHYSGIWTTGSTFGSPTTKHQSTGASSVKGRKDIWQLEHMPCEKRLNTLGLFSLEKALEHVIANFHYLKVNY